MARYVIALLILCIFKRFNRWNTPLFKLSVKVINFLRKKNFFWLNKEPGSGLTTNEKTFWDQLMIIIISMCLTTLHNIILNNDYYLIMTFFILFFTYLLSATFFRLKLTFKNQNFD